MKFCVYTLGCKVNQYESESIINQIKSAGHQYTTALEFADVYIVNTCAVTSLAEHKSRGVIAKINKLNPNAKIYVCGCSSELHPQSYTGKQNVVGVIGSENKHEIFTCYNNGTSPQFKELSTNYNDNYTIAGERIRSFIKVQDGCNNFCSYCIIPYTRGRERSRTVESTESEVAEVVKFSKEVVIVGINIAGYGKDLTPKKTLVDIVNIFKKYPDVRLRFSSFEMGTITEELLKALKNISGFCPFFHLSLQSGDNAVLQKMNRQYTIEEYAKTVKLIRQYFPTAGISTDIIVGFPTETEESFNNSLTNVKNLKFSNLHIFPYSPREGTVASKYKQINGEIVKERVNKLTQIKHQTEKHFIEENLNKTHSVLLETTAEDGTLVGFTKNYIKCYLKGNLELINQIVNVKLVNAYKDGAMSEVAE